jgi:outer membrane protein assembly factor BamB
LHKWSYKIATDIWPNSQKDDAKAYFWRRAHLYENGDLLAMYSNYGLIKIDKDSNLIWFYTSNKKPHHDLEVTKDGKIYLLTQEMKPIHGIPEHLTALEDFITILSQEGSVIKHVSLFELLEKSPYAGLIDYDAIIKSIRRRLAMRRRGELFHTNTIEVFDGKLEHKSHIFKKGNVMVSMLWLNTIFIINMESEEIIWALGSGMWTRQHQPTLLENGNILIFNNIYTDTSSRVMEFDPFTQEIVWDYKGNSKNKFFSKTCGSNQRLPNGNTLITETDYGRAFEVTKNSKIVWEFVNPFRAGEKNELIATLLEMIRISLDYCLFLNGNKINQR